MEQLEDDEQLLKKSLPEIRQNPKYSLLFKILFICLILIVIVLIIVIILLGIKINKDNNDKKDENNNSNILENAGFIESWNSLYGIRIENISFIEESTMNNTFKIGGINYKDEIGIINAGKDYAKNENNKYNLYIPKEAINKKSNYNGIILFIHGENEKKENIEYYCARYAKSGYITATMDYTEISKNNPESNVFRIMDEITYCLKHIKNLLENKYKFTSSKLELALGGYSIGSYYAMLYSYLMKKTTPIPIKFIINLAGFLDLDPNSWYKVSTYNKTLNDIEPKSIKEAINNNTIIKIHDDEVFFLNKMNDFLGQRYSEDQIKQMLNGNKINQENQLYKELYKSSKYFFVTYYINNTINDEYIPILSEYAGNDENIGVANFKNLRQIQEKNNNFIIDIIYMQYANHSLINYDTENGINAMQDIHNMILKYSKKYFKDENYDARQQEINFANGGHEEKWYILYGEKKENISYAKNGKIENTYKEKGSNYIEEIGNVNEGNDYEANQYNIYNLYIPKAVLNKKNKFNGVFLFLHGGGRYKEDMDYLCARYAKSGYITATMDYNDLNKNHSINAFRIFDEITKCLIDIKERLKTDYEIDNTKLELAIGGHSFGSEIAMIYGYSMYNKSPIPIKFVINQAGSLDVIPEYSYKVAKTNVTLADIEPKSIDEGITNKTLIYSADNKTILNWYNNFLDKKYTNNQIEQMLDEKKEYIEYDSDLYKEFYKKIKYFYISHYMNETISKKGSIIPLLSEYAGNDNMISGVAQFKFIRLLSEEYKFPVDLVYMRYGNHYLMDYKTQNSIDALRDLHTKILNFAKLYFKSENYEEETKEKLMDEGGYNEPWNVLYGYKYENLSYAKNGIIENTFGINGSNYDEELGNINNGKNYTENKYNIYNLYIPTMAIKNKNNYNKIIIFLHGANLNKENMDYACSRYAKLGYITATLDFSFNNLQYDANLFLIIDEMTSAIGNIKQRLKDNFEFNVDKLELAFFGFSFGGYLSLLYGYAMKEKSIIPIKFIINQAGFLDLNRQYYYKLKEGKEPLLDIEPDTIKKGIENGTLTALYPNDIPILSTLNNFIGKQYNQSQLDQMLDKNNFTNYTNELYKEFYNKTRHCFVSYYINKTENGKFIPVLSEIGGKDTKNGIAQFSLLRNLSNEHDFKIDIVYMKYSAHLILSPDTDDGVKGMRDMHSYILEYSKKYFTSDQV